MVRGNDLCSRVLPRVGDPGPMNTPTGTFYVCQACRHPNNHHSAVGTRACASAYPEACPCTAYQAPRWDNEIRRSANDLETAGRNLARLAGRLDDPIDLTQFFAELAGWIVESRLHQAGKAEWIKDPNSLRRATTELLQGALEEAQAGYDDDYLEPVKGEFLREYLDTVTARK